MKRTKPIDIAPSRSTQPNRQHHQNDDQSGCSSAISDEDTLPRDIANRNARNVPLRQENFEALNSSMEGLTVGSLPSSRRQRRMMISTGGNEVLSSVGLHHHNNGNNYSRDMRLGTGRRKKDDMIMAQSMPNAPFLQSRKDYDNKERLSQMPKMNLPESASETVESQASTYGSLRESHFNLLDDRHSRDNTTTSKGGGGGIGMSLGNENGSLYTRGLYGNNSNNGHQGGQSFHGQQSQVSFSHQPTSLQNGYLHNTRQNDNIHQSNEGNGKSSVKNRSNLASLLGDSGMKNSSSSNSITTGGIGSLVHSNLRTTEPMQPNDHRNDISGRIMISSPFNNRNEGQLVDHQREVLGSSFKDESAMKPSTSLTGLDILSSSRQSPGGLGITLTPEEKESAIHRARSMSGDGSMFLLPSSSESPHNHYSQSKSPLPHLLAPKSLALGGPSQQQHSKSFNSLNSADGYSSRRNLHRPSSPPPDTFGAFDLDMDG